MAERIEVGGATLAYEDTGGAGPAVVFAHGLGGSANGWLAQLAECRARGWRGVAYDQRGAGVSEKPPGPYSLERWSADLAELLDGLGIQRAALVGHSVGCMVAERAALALGERVWALAVCGGARAWPAAAGPVFEERARLAREGLLDQIAEAVAATGLSERARGEDPRLHGLMRALIAGNDGRAYAESALATAAASMADLERISCPLLAFCGSEDTVTPVGAAEEIAEAAPRGVFATVPGAAHWCMLEAPEATNEVLFGFLEETAPAI